MSQSFGNTSTFIARYRESDGKEQQLWEHLVNVSKWTGTFANEVGLGKTGQLIGLVHDLGKGTHEFNRYIRKAVGLTDESSLDLTGRKLDHSTAGAQVVYEAFLGPGGQATFASDILALTVASHHGLMDALTPHGEDYLLRRMAKDESETRKEEALSFLPPEIFERMKKLIDSNIENEIEAFLLAAFEETDQWVERYFKVGLLVRFLLSCLIDADRLDAADFESPINQRRRQYGEYIPWPVLIERLEKHIRKFSVNTSIDILRRDISEQCLEVAGLSKGFFRLTVPTGGGKTLSSLRFALHHAYEHDLERIIYVIPYTSIIDQNAQRIREALDISPDEAGVVLEHHSNLVPERQNDRNELLAENWDTPIVLTTMVQLLESLFGSGTNHCRRMHQLANSVIIFDEIQTLPVKTVHPFNLAMRFLVNGCGSTVMLCTATQPLLHEVEASRALPYDPQREITPPKRLKQDALNRVEVLDRTRPQGWSTKQVAELAIEELHSRGSVLVIVNTKKHAADIFEYIRKGTDYQVYHLSTNMCPAHRLDKLDEIHRLLGTTPLICVSTQLIEAGVDIDFGVVIRSLAGIDSIAQAAGRCNRHGHRPEKGRVILINSNEESLTKLPDIAIAKKVTERILEEFKNDKDGLFHGHLLSEPVMEQYFRYYFHERSYEMAYWIDPNSPVGRSDTLVDLLSSNHKSVKAYQLMNKRQLPNRFLRQSFRTASKCFYVIKDAGQGVIVPYGAQGKELIADLCEAYEPQLQFDLLRRAQRFSVNCFPHVLSTLDEEGAIYEVQEGAGIYYLDERYYHDFLGLTTHKSSAMSTLAR